MKQQKSSSESSHQSNRRDFLKTSAAGVAATSVPYFFSTQRTLADETKSKNDRPALGLIGSGGMGMGNMNACKQWVDVVAIADVDQKRRESAKAKLGNGKADVFNDYRKVIERDDVDVIHVATPDHWHTKPLVEAMLAGKDVYCEKPMTLTIDEGKLIRKVQKETGRIVQVGTQQRSQFNLFVKAMAIVAEGRLGRIKKITAGIGGAPTSGAIPVHKVPAELDWDRWLGPTPKVDFRMSPQEDGKKKKRRPNTNCHYEFRWWYEYSGGKLTDWGAHHVDIAAWALRLNGQSAGPVSVGGTAEHPVEFKDGFPVQNDQYNTANSFHFISKYANGTEIHIKSGGDNGCLIEGDKGRIFVNRGKLVGGPVEDLKEKPLAEDAIKNAYKGLEMEGDGRGAHWANFLKCARDKKEPISDVHSHMAMLNICHLCGISARLGREVKWDAKNEQILGDDQANGFIARKYREGYAIDLG